MSYLEAIVLGIIQGLTEFLPVSSSGHLELAKILFGNETIAKESMTFTVVLHFATALSTVLIFRRDIAEIFKGLFQFKVNESSVFSLKIIISMLPAVAIGLMFESQLETFFSGQLFFVGLMLLITALLLLLADRTKTTQKDTSFVSATLIGIAQAVAMLPGISRSGATIATSVLLKIDRMKAARFSFLMVVPLIFGKIAKDLLGGHIVFEQSHLLPMVLGFIAAFFSGLLACKWMLALVKKSKLYYFSIYCAIVGAVAVTYSLLA
ncbi:MAG: undecaprenyl-diphosphate phosphatase [Flavicella sp.]